MRWQLTAFFLYPLRGQGGVLLLLWSIGLYASLALLDWSRIDSGWHTLTMILLPVAWSIAFGVFLQYAWLTLRHVAAGHTQPVRSVAIDDVSPLANPLAVLVALLLFGLAGALEWSFAVSPWLGTAAAVIVCALLPAALGVMVLEERFLPGLSGTRIARFAARLRWAYVPYAASMYVAIAPLYVTCFLIAPDIAAIVCASYVFVLGHVLAGTVLHRHRDRLDLLMAPEVEAVQRAGEVETAQAIDALTLELHRLCGVDRVKEASTRLEAFLRDADYRLDERMHQRLLEFHDRRLLLEHNWHYLHRLLDAGKLPRAWLLLRSSLDIDPLFRPGTAAAALRLIAVASPADAEYALALLRDFERAYPADALLPDALLEHARWSFVHLGRADAALALLARIDREFPAAAASQEFRTFASRVRRFGSSAGPTDPADLGRMPN